MNRVYSFAIRLQDMFSPQMQRIASMYEQRTAFMSRMWSRVTGMMNGTVQTVANLRTRLAGLGSGFRIRVDSSEVERGASRVSRLLTMLRSVAGQSAIIGGLVGGGVMGVVDSVQAHIGQGYDKTVGAAQRNQTAMFSMDELMGKDTALSIIGQIDKYAPEKRDQLIAGANRLSGSGMVPEKIMETLQSLNNMAAVSNGKATVEDLASVIAKVQAAGRIQGEEKEMLTDRGININPYLAKAMGVQVSQIAKLQEKGAITSDIFEKAIQLMAGKGGKLDGAYERFQASTTEGKEAVVGGKFDALMRGFGDKMLPFKDGLLSILMDVLKGTGPVVQVFEKLWGAVRPVWDGIVGLLKSFGILNKEGLISEGLINTLNFLWEYFGKVLEVVGFTFWVITKTIGGLVDSKLAMLVIGIYAVVKAWGLLNFIMSINPFAQVVIGIAAVVAGILYAWDTFDKFREGILRVWETIKSIFSNLGNILKAMLTGTIGDVVGAIGKAWSEGASNGISAVNQDRIDRLNEKRAGRRAREGKGKNNLPGIPDFDPLKSDKDSSSLAAAAGLNSTAGNSKSSSVVIKINSLIEKSDIHITDFQGNYDELESKLIDALLRVVNSGTRAVTA